LFAKNVTSVQMFRYEQSSRHRVGGRTVQIMAERVMLLLQYKFREAQPFPPFSDWHSGVFYSNPR